MRQKWEYMRLVFSPFDDRDNIQDQLNQQGAKGWELVSVVVSREEHVYWLKRELTQPSSSPKTGGYYH